MIQYFQKRFVLSPEGAKSLVGGIVWTTFLHIVFMLPAIYTYVFLLDYLQNSASHSLAFYVLLAFGFMLTIFVVALFQYTNTYTKIYTESATRRISLAEKLRKLPLSFFGEKNLSDLTSTMMEDSTMLEMIFSHSVPQLFASAASIVLITIALFFFNWQLALSLFWVVPFAGLIIVFSKKKLNSEFESNYHIKREVTEQIQEGIEEIQEIKSYNGEANYLQRFDKSLERYERSLIQGELLCGVLLNLSYIVLRLGLATVILVGAYLFAREAVDLFTYLIFLMIGANIYNPVIEAFGNMAVLQFLDVRINRMREMEQMPMQQGIADYSVANYNIEFSDVEFSYQEDKQVLRNISFTAAQGEVTALVGPSGGGKSTTAKLAARFWDVDRGTIRLGGVDISTIDPEALLSNYAIVFQDVMLFNASVADNIRIGKKDATDEEIRRVARLAQCEEFIARLPNGYDTLIGENGEALSGGERQRISIARALLKDAPIILLDEATASLDVENESRIQGAISELIKDKTVLLIAHRMRTVANAHKVVVIKDGEVAECGSPAELKALNGEFARMLAAQ